MKVLLIVNNCICVWKSHLQLQPAQNTSIINTYSINSLSGDNSALINVIIDKFPSYGWSCLGGY